MASKEWRDKIMMSLRKTFHISDDPVVAADYEGVIARLNNAQAAVAYDKMITEPLDFAPKPGMLLKWGRGDNKQKETQTIYPAPPAESGGKWETIARIMSGEIVLKGNYKGLAYDDIPRRNALRQELGWKKIR